MKRFNIFLLVSCILILLTTTIALKSSQTIYTSFNNSESSESLNYTGVENITRYLNLDGNQTAVYGEITLNGVAGDLAATENITMATSVSYAMGITTNTTDGTAPTDFWVVAGSTNNKIYHFTNGGLTESSNWAVCVGQSTYGGIDYDSYTDTLWVTCRNMGGTTHEIEEWYKNGSIASSLNVLNTAMTSESYYGIAVENSSHLWLSSAWLDTSNKQTIILVDKSDGSVDDRLTISNSAWTAMGIPWDNQYMYIDKSNDYFYLTTRLGTLSDVVVFDETGTWVANYSKMTAGDTRGITLNTLTEPVYDIWTSFPYANNQNYEHLSAAGLTNPKLWIGDSLIWSASTITNELTLTNLSTAIAANTSACVSAICQAEFNFEGNSAGIMSYESLMVKTADVNYDVSVIKPRSSWSYPGNPKVELYVSGTENSYACNYTINGGGSLVLGNIANSTITTFTSIPELAEGDYNLSVRCINSSFDATSDPVPFTVDKVNHTLASITKDSTPYLTLSTPISSTLKYNVDGGSNTTVATGTTGSTSHTTALSFGTHTFNIFSTQTDVYNTNVSFVVDIKKPTLMIFPAQETEWVNFFNQSYDVLIYDEDTMKRADVIILTNNSVRDTSFRTATKTYKIPLFGIGYGSYEDGVSANIGWQDEDLSNDQDLNFYSDFGSYSTNESINATSSVKLMMHRTGSNSCGMGTDIAKGVTADMSALTRIDNGTALFNVNCADNSNYLDHGTVFLFGVTNATVLSTDAEIIINQSLYELRDTSAQIISSSITANEGIFEPDDDVLLYADYTTLNNFAMNDTFTVTASIVKSNGTIFEVTLNDNGQENDTYSNDRKFTGNFSIGAMGTEPSGRWNVTITAVDSSGESTTNVNTLPLYISGGKLSFSGTLEQADTYVENGEPIWWRENVTLNVTGATGNVTIYAKNLCPDGSGCYMERVSAVPYIYTTSTGTSTGSLGLNFTYDTSAGNVGLFKKYQLKNRVVLANIQNHGLAHNTTHYRQRYGYWIQNLNNGGCNGLDYVEHNISNLNFTIYMRPANLDIWNVLWYESGEQFCPDGYTLDDFVCGNNTANINNYTVSSNITEGYTKIEVIVNDIGSFYYKDCFGGASQIVGTVLVYPTVDYNTGYTSTAVEDLLGTNYSQLWKYRPYWPLSYFNAVDRTWEDPYHDEYYQVFNGAQQPDGWYYVSEWTLSQIEEIRISVSEDAWSQGTDSINAPDMKRGAINDNIYYMQNDEFTYASRNIVNATVFDTTKNLSYTGVNTSCVDTYHRQWFTAAEPYTYHEFKFENICGTTQDINWKLLLELWSGSITSTTNRYIDILPVLDNVSSPAEIKINASDWNTSYALSYGTGSLGKSGGYFAFKNKPETLWLTRDQPTAFDDAALDALINGDNVNRSNAYLTARWNLSIPAGTQQSIKFALGLSGNDTEAELHQELISSQAAAMAEASLNDVPQITHWSWINGTGVFSESNGTASVLINTTYNTPVNFTITASDTDDGDTISYYYKISSFPSVECTGGSCSVNFTNYSGYRTFQLIATDTAENDTQTFMVNVTGGNSVPTIDTSYPVSSEITINENVTQVFNITYSDEESNPMTVSWELNGTEVSTSDDYNFTTNYSSSGSYLVNVTVDDGYGSTSTSWVVNVTDVTDCSTIGISNACVINSETFTLTENITSQGLTLSGSSPTLDCDGYTITGAGGSISSLSGSNVMVRDCIFNITANGNFLAFSDNGNITILNNTFMGNTYGSNLLLIDSSQETINISGNTVNAVGNISCLGDCDSDPSIYNESSWNNVPNAIRIDTVSGDNLELYIQDNTFENITGYAFYIYSSDFRSKVCDISSNNIPRSYASIRASYGCNIHHNTKQSALTGGYGDVWYFRDGGFHNIYANELTDMYRGNIFYGRDTVNNTVENNTGSYTGASINFGGYSQHDIYLRGASHNNTIRWNNITSVTPTASGFTFQTVKIEATSLDNKIIDNRFVGYENGTGVDDSSSTTWTDNEFHYMKGVTNILVWDQTINGSYSSLGFEIDLNATGDSVVYSLNNTDNYTINSSGYVVFTGDSNRRSDVIFYSNDSNDNSLIEYVTLTTDFTCDSNIVGPTYTDWSTCTNSQKTRNKSWTDTNYSSCCLVTGLDEDCSIDNGTYDLVVETLSCSTGGGGGGSCVPYWVCTDWSDCDEGSRSRTCSNQNPMCNINKPATTESCSEGITPVFSIQPAEIQVKYLETGKTYSESFTIRVSGTIEGRLKISADSNFIDFGGFDIIRTNIIDKKDIVYDIVVPQDAIGEKTIVFTFEDDRGVKTERMLKLYISEDRSTAETFETFLNTDIGVFESNSITEAVGLSKENESYFTLEIGEMIYIGGAAILLIIIAMLGMGWARQTRNRNAYNKKKMRRY